MIFIALFLFITPLFAINTEADSFILINAETGNILYEKNPKKPVYPASLTKIATCLYALQNQENDLDKVITAERESVATLNETEVKRSNYTLPPHYLNTGMSHIGIKVGEQLKFQDLLYGMMLASGGDACNVIAQSVSGTIPKFIEEMNLYLAEIGCVNTRFLNAHGYHHPEHKTTASDLALITQEAMKSPAFRKVVKTVNYQRPATNKQAASILTQTNRLLKKGKFYYPHAIGVKTGYTSQAKHCLVAAAENNDRKLIAVILGHPDRDEMFLEARKFFENAFKEKKIKRTLLSKGPQKATLQLQGASSPVKTYTEEDIAISYYPSEEPLLKCYLFWDSLELPIEKGARVGEMHLKDRNDEIAYRVTLFSQEPVHKSFNYLYIIIAGCTAFVVTFLLYRKRS